MGTAKCVLCCREAEVRGSNRQAAYVVRCQTCGEYRFTEEAAESLEHMNAMERARISGVTRERSEQGSPIGVSSARLDPPQENWYGITQVLQELAPGSIDEKVSRGLGNLRRKSKYLGEEIPLEPDTDYPLVFADNQNGFQLLVDDMISHGLVQQRAHYDQGGGTYVLTAEGWRRSERESK